MNVAQEIEYREYIYKYIIYEASPLEKAVVKLVQKVDRSTEDGGWIIFKFQMPLEKATWPDIIGYPDVLSWKARYYADTDLLE